MVKRGWVVASVGCGVVMVGVVVAACGVEDVKATDYNQSCSQNDDCILVEQLSGSSGTDCTISCVKGAINRKDEDKYEKELKEEKGSCTSEARPFCDNAQVAQCVSGKCTAVSATPILDAGSD